MATETKTRIITLTGRPPVKIRDDQWPVIASVNGWDTEYECQSYRSWSLRVRQHEDGRAVVYGLYDSAFHNEPNRRAGELVAAGGDIAAAIHRVAADCGCERIAGECISDLPAQEI